MNNKLFVGVVLFGLAASSAWAQCQGFKTQPLQQAVLTPAQAAALGQVTATTAVFTNANGSLYSHVITVTPGTWVGFAWSSANGASGNGQRYYTIDNGTTHYGVTTWGPSGSQSQVWLMASGDVGHTYHNVYVVTDANGHTTQDHDDVSVVAGSGPSITYQDGLPTNYYAQVSLVFSAPSMVKGCAVCTQDPGYCSGVHHTPYFSGLLTNHVSGEQQTITKLQAGAVVDQNTALAGSGSIWISWLPGDTIDGTVEGSVDCSVLGDGIYDSTIPEPKTMMEMARVRVSWNPTSHNTTPYNSARSSPCDYKGPLYVPSSWTDPTTGQGPAGFQDWEAIGTSIIINGSPDNWIFPPTYDEASGRNVTGTYPPVLSDCTNSAAKIFPPLFPFLN